MVATLTSGMHPEPEMTLHHASLLSFSDTDDNKGFFSDGTRETTRRRRQQRRHGFKRSLVAMVTRIAVSSCHGELESPYPGNEFALKTEMSNLQRPFIRTMNVL